MIKLEDVIVKQLVSSGWVVEADKSKTCTMAVASKDLAVNRSAKAFLEPFSGSLKLSGYHKKSKGVALEFRSSRFFPIKGMCADKVSKLVNSFSEELL